MPGQFLFTMACACDIVLTLTDVRLLFIMPSLLKHQGTVLGICILFAVYGAGCKQSGKNDLRPSPAPSGTEIVIAAVGDIMMPSSIQKAAALNNYNYDFLFDSIAGDLSSDVVFANLETPVDQRSSPAGYPRFNARPELLSALKKAGVGVVSVANNHALDAGPRGLRRTLDNIEAAGMRFTGAGRTRTEAERPAFLSANEVTVAFLAYTYSTNVGLPKKKKGMPAVNILRRDSNEELMRAADHVRKARNSADIVVVSLHWSDEYRVNVTPWQRRAAVELMEAGADVILGHHPHVLQPVEPYTARDGRKCVIAFSLGNFLSGQNYGISDRNRAHARARRGDGIILTIHARREQGKTSIIRVEFLPIWALREKFGTTSFYHPVSIAREMDQLASKEKRTNEEDRLLALLGYRQKVIRDQLTKPGILPR